jgi:hypothetical protein
MMRLKKTNTIFVTLFLAAVALGLSGCAQMPVASKVDSTHAGNVEALRILVMVDTSPANPFRQPKDYLIKTGWVSGEAFDVLGPRIVNNIEKNGLKTSILAKLGPRILQFGEVNKSIENAYTLLVTPKSLVIAQKYHHSIAVAVNLLFNLYPPNSKSSVLEWEQNIAFHSRKTAADKISMAALNLLAEHKLFRPPEKGISTIDGDASFPQGGNTDWDIQNGKPHVRPW